MHVARVVAVALCASSLACAHAIVSPSATPPTPASEALLVLPGFGYGRAGEQAFRSLAGSIRAEGLDLYLPTYISRPGLGTSRERLEQFIRDQRLERYERVHVFAFLAGGWTFNPLIETHALPNLSTVIYDRSPYQERGPAIASEKLGFFTWLKYGLVVFDVARTPYRPVTAPGVRVGLLVETMPTPFIRRFARTADQQGPYRFECDAFGQRHDDCTYVAMNHDELYTRFGEVWPEIQAFIRTGRFTSAANRAPPAADRPTAKGKAR